MKLSLVFELLLIFVLLAFAASKSVRKQKNNKKGVQNRNDADKLEDNSINKYCKCSENHCNCCRDFSVPVVNLHGPGCASLMYLNGDKMAVSISFGKKVITNRTLSSRKPTPVCMPLPGGISKFCGRVYNIARAGEEFRACLGLELQSKSTVEAAVRVSCFKFGPRGVTSEQADPLPLVPQTEKVGDDEDDDDDDDDDDDFGLGGDDDDDDDDDDDGDLASINDVDSADYTGFSLLGEDLLGDLFGSTDKKPNKNKKKQAPAPSTTTTRRPRPTRRPIRRPARTTTPKPTRVTTPSTPKVRPGTRRPTRKPVRRRRPTRKPTTTSITAESTQSTPTVATTQSLLEVVPVVTAAPVVVPSTERSEPIEMEAFEPVIGFNEKFSPAMYATTDKTVTDFGDSGLEMSLAHITGQLSNMHVTPIVSDAAKDSSMPSTMPVREINYEKIETITPRMPTTISFPTSEEKVNEDMIEIVQNLDSQSEESTANTEFITEDESRKHTIDDFISETTLPTIEPPKKKSRNGFNFGDLDVLHLTEIGETVGDELGIFGKNKRRNRKPHKGRDGDNDDYSDFLNLGDMDSLLRKSGDGKIKKDRRRQNKMMRGEW